jgi:hypothetical protein
MPACEYRLYFDGTAATREQLDQIETITIDQELDLAWEARLDIPMCTSKDGTWAGAEESFAAAFARIRVEIKVGDGSFVPLIDGPVVGANTQMSTQPGQSMQTVIVQDDSVYLNRHEDVDRFDDKLDHEVAQELFDRVSQITDTDIDDTPAPPAGSAVVVQRGTAMQLLRRLARRQGMHAYVLPGDQPGESVGAFKKLPTEPDGLPELVLLGESRNVATFHVQQNSQRPSTVRTASVDITDKTVATATSSFRNLELLGDDAALASEDDAATRLASPGADDAVDPTQQVQGEADRDSYAFSATGSVVADCYTGVLQPYRAVLVKGVDTILNGNYVVKKVGHTLSRSEYAQTFELLRNAVADGQSSAGQLGAIL